MEFVPRADGLHTALQKRGFFAVQWAQIEQRTNLKKIY